jgi:hypothetical protein
MKKQVPATVVAMVVLAGIVAQPPTANAFGDRMVIGGYYTNGIAMVAGDGYEEWRNFDRDNRTAKFSVGGGGYFDFFFTPYVGIEAGIGFLNKGIRFSHSGNSYKESIVYMEMPFMVKIDFRHFQAAFGFALSIALSGRSITKYDERKEIDRWDGNEWDYVHRANLGPKIALGYAIPVGPIFIVPGMSWTMHLINDLNNDDIPPDGTDYQARAVNLMFTVAVEWIIP